MKIDRRLRFRFAPFHVPLTRPQSASMLLLSRPTRFASTSTLSFSRSLSSTRLRFDAVSAAASDLRKDKADWKRRQSGSNFVDTLSMTVTSGKGGAGGVAFHREKFKVG